MEAFWLSGQGLEFVLQPYSYNNNNKIQILVSTHVRTHPCDIRLLSVLAFSQLSTLLRGPHW
jgi:hypothetical protein